MEANWLFVHNGFIVDFHLLRRDMMLAIDPKLFPASGSGMIRSARSSRRSG